MCVLSPSCSVGEQSSTYFHEPMFSVDNVPDFTRYVYVTVDVTGTFSGVGAPRPSTLSDVPSVVFFLFPTCYHVPRSHVIVILLPSQPPCPAFLYRRLTVSLCQCNHFQLTFTNLVWWHLNSHSEAEPFYPPIVDETPLSTTQPALFTHTLEAESADVDQTLVKSAPDD